MARGEKKAWTYVVETTEGRETFHTDHEADQPENGILAISLGDDKGVFFSPHYWRKVTVTHQG